MSEQQLRRDLEQLKSLVGNMSPDDSSRTRLASLVADMEQHLEQHGMTGNVQGFRLQLEAAVSRFETSHPTAAAIVNNVLTTLGNMGV